MGQCGPVDPCKDCIPIYAKDPRYVPDENRPGSFRIALDVDRRKRPRPVRVATVSSLDRVPVPYESKGAAQRRRRAKSRRRS